MIYLNYFYYEMKCQEEILYDYLEQCRQPDAEFTNQIDNDDEYMEPFITAAEYLDDIDMYVDERPTAIVEIDYSAGPWVYFYNQKIPNIDVKEKTHKEFGFVGRLPGAKVKKYYID